MISGGGEKQYNSVRAFLGACEAAKKANVTGLTPEIRATFKKLRDHSRWGLFLNEKVRARYIESLPKAVRSLGFDETLAKALVAQTIKGSLGLLDSQGGDAAAMRARVTSKGGTTQAAMDVFAKNNFEKTFKTALGAAKKRAKELSK